MPKITAHGGASDATLPVPETETAAVDVPAPEAEPLDATEPMTQEGGDERTVQPVACPTDGEPLEEGPDGELFCPFDGWRPGDRYVGC